MPSSSCICQRSLHCSCSYLISRKHQYHGISPHVPGIPTFTSCRACPVATRRHMKGMVIRSFRTDSMEIQLQSHPQASTRGGPLLHHLFDDPASFMYSALFPGRPNSTRSASTIDGRKLAPVTVARRKNPHFENKNLHIRRSRSSARRARLLRGPKPSQHSHEPVKPNEYADGTGALECALWADAYPRVP